jgi:hypothetical protein
MQDWHSVNMVVPAALRFYYCRFADAALLFGVASLTLRFYLVSLR